MMDIAVCGHLLVDAAHPALHVVCLISSAACRLGGAVQRDDMSNYVPKWLCSNMYSSHHLCTGYSNDHNMLRS